jgi:hypothetical protein
MQHGIDHYFIERKRSGRRVSYLSVGVGGALLVILWIPSLPPFAHLLRDTPILRFGFEGPNRYVPVVHLEATIGVAEPLVNIGRVETVRSKAGGGGTPTASRAPNSAPARRGRLPGAGEDDHDLVARALADQGRVPIMQSTELIIEKLVRPSYPEDAHDRGIEGRSRSWRSSTPPGTSWTSRS